jgi:hypothetical protein
MCLHYTKRKATNTVSQYRSHRSKKIKTLLSSVYFNTYYMLFCFVLLLFLFVLFLLLLVLLGIIYNKLLKDFIIYSSLLEVVSIRAPVRNIRDLNTFHTSFSRNKCAVCCPLAESQIQSVPLTVISLTSVS